MNTIICVLGLSPAVGVLILLGIGVFFGFSISYFIYLHDKNKLGLPGSVIKKLRIGKDIKKSQESSEEKKSQIILPGDFDFVKEPGGQINYGRVCSLLDPKLMIRHLKPDKNDKDRNLYAVSLPHNFGNNIVGEFLRNFPQIIRVDVIGSHEIVILKSPAVELSDVFESQTLGSAILRFLFSKLNYFYNWEKIEQDIFVSFYPNEKLIGFNFNLELYHHNKLCLKLAEIEGLLLEFPNEKGNYHFKAEREESLSWDDLRPEIEKVFCDYFPAGVKFSGAWNSN